MSKYQWRSIISTWKSWGKNKGNMHIMTYVVQFGYLFYVCSVASYWMINLFTSTNKREKRRELKLNQNKTKHVTEH